MSDWYYLKYRKPVPYGCDILTDPSGYIKIYNKQYIGKKRYTRFIRRKFIGPYHVSTIFLGLDHGHNGVPMLFETMVFKGNSSSDLYCERCTTHRQALKQHQQAIEWVNNE